MSAAQLPTRDHAFVRDQPSPELRALALDMFGPKPQPRPAHLATKATLSAIAAEAHSELRAETPCQMPRGECWVCDREPGRHVAVDEPLDPQEAAESATAESYGEWAREGGGW